MIDGIKQLGSLSLTRGAGSVSSLTDNIFGSEQTTPAQQTGQSFASVLGNVSVDAMNNLKKAEVASFEGIQGKANTREAVAANRHRAPRQDRVGLSRHYQDADLAQQEY